MMKTPLIERIELFPLHVPFRAIVREAMARSAGGLGMAIPAAALDRYATGAAVRLERA
jgi:hypothetical protein